MSVIVIAGPTASGKTSLGVTLAKRLNGEIISCDSMQIYRGMDIGTAKPTKEEMAQVPHHIIDIKSPDENFSCAEYQLLAKNIINDIIKNVPLNGTFFICCSIIEFRRT